MKKAVITGVGGFIGGALARALLKAGYEVCGIARTKDYIEDLLADERFTLILADFEVYRNLGSLIEEKDFDAFYHLAWQGYGKETNNVLVQERNIIASREALEAAVALGSKKFIYAGSCHEYLKDRTSADASYAECSIYGAAKRAGELWCRAIARNRIEYNSILFMHIFGAGDRSMRSANSMILRLLNHQDLDLIEGNILHDWTYIDDAVEGLIQVGENGINGKQYYIGARNLKTFAEIVRDMRDVLYPKAALNFGKYQDAAFVDYSCIDLNGLFADTGFECREDFKESIVKTANWLKEFYKV